MTTGCYTHQLGETPTLAACEGGQHGVKFLSWEWSAWKYIAASHPRNLWLSNGPVPSLFLVLKVNIQSFPGDRY